MRLPIDDLHREFMTALDNQKVVLSAPTGSGKSTQVPRWCAVRGSVLVVEPRRVAARGLAVRVASLEETKLGDRVGYIVRNDRRANADTNIIYATPGVVLRMAASGDLDGFATVIVDEFHERTLDVDLLLALLIRQYSGSLVVMSATLNGDKIAAHLGGVLLCGEGRAFPVERLYLPFGEKLPTDQGLTGRVSRALKLALERDGDILVFLPGKGEIERVYDGLGGLDADVVKLHGQLPLDEQARIFKPSKKRRVILSTNVAETSVTVPRIGIVIDSGLVRRTRYHRGRGYLTLTAIAKDSAEQRAGRAGRTRAGVAFHLWAETAPLTSGTPPEIHRESLVPLLLAAAACGAPDLNLPFLDVPKDYAVADAREDLEVLGAIDANGLTERGKALFNLPLPAHLGRLLLEAEARNCMDDAIDLVAGLAVHKPLFRRDRPADDEMRDENCDATATIRAVRFGRPDDHHLDRYALREAREARKRLRKAWKRLGEGSQTGSIDRRRLAVTAMRADRRMVHVARRRKRGTAWSNGGTEVTLGRYCGAAETDADALVAWDTRALARGDRSQEVIITAATPCPLPWLIEAEIGVDRVGAVSTKNKVAKASIERVFAGKVLGRTDRIPTGEAAITTFSRLFLEGRIFRNALSATKSNLRLAGLSARLEGRQPPPSLEEWADAQFRNLGVESGRDLGLLSADDVTYPPLPQVVREQLEREYPPRVTTPDATYEVDYDPTKRTVTLRRLRGSKKAPPLRFLPRWTGWRIVYVDNSNVRVLRGR